jgi:hypothetical protein
MSNVQQREQHVGSVPMATREAACHCGQLRLDVEGDPFVVSMCHCLACQRRTGSAFGLQAAFTPDQVQVVGRFNDYARISDEADSAEHVFHFCPECGSTVFYREPDCVVVMVGAFADPHFPAPVESVYDHRKHQWLTLPDSIKRDEGAEAWAAVHPLYEAGRYAEAAERGRELLDTVPHPRVFFNVACCESRAGQTAAAIEHLRQGIELWEGLREMAQQDPDFDPIRDEPAFKELVG